MNLSQRLQNLPFELHYMIIEKYKNMYIFPEIVKRNKNILEKLKNDLIDFDVDLEDLIDVSNILIFSKVLNKQNIEKGRYFIYSEKCITGFIEYYFSLTLSERKILNDFVLENNNYNLITNADYNKRRSIHDKLTEYIFKHKLSNLIDPEDLHSGGSVGWCISNIIPIIFGNYEQRLDHWIRLIRGHFSRAAF